ncbi:MAG: YdeI/OmpD-associated family protein [Acidobacteriaceae bacterium]
MQQTFSIRLIGRGPKGAWTHLPIPFSVEEIFGAKGRVAVRGTINAIPFRSSIMPRGDGTHYMAVNQTIRAAAGAGIGDMVKVVMEPDTAKRTVTVPPYLKKALAAASQNNTFAALSYSHRKELVDWIAQAKKLETRASRIEKCIAMLAKRKRA